MLEEDCTPGQTPADTGTCMACSWAFKTLCICPSAGGGLAAIKSHAKGRGHKKAMAKYAQRCFVRLLLTMHCCAHCCAAVQRQRLLLCLGCSAAAATRHRRHPPPPSPARRRFLSPQVEWDKPVPAQHREEGAVEG
jgi:hypothetical protein